MTNREIEEFVSQNKIYMLGHTIEVNDFLCCRPEKIQYRFPKSKKTRIREKWRKQLRNFKTVENHYAYKVDNRIIVSNKIYNKLKEKSND